MEHLSADVRSLIEADRNGTNVFKLLDGLVDEGNHVSLSALDDLTSVVFGKGLADVLAMGYTLESLIGNDGLIVRTLRDLGFISEKAD